MDPNLVAAIGALDPEATLVTTVTATKVVDPRQAPRAATTGEMPPKAFCPFAFGQRKMVGLSQKAFRTSEPFTMP